MYQLIIIILDAFRKLKFMSEPLIIFIRKTMLFLTPAIKISYFKILLLICFLPAGAGLTNLLAGDFDGDGKDDIAVFRPADGLWAIRNVTRFYFGATGDYPVPLSYNSSSASDPAIFRPASGLWAVRGTTRIYYGNSKDSPVIGDYDGDGRDEIGIFRGSSGLWAIQGVTRVYFGSGKDIPVPGEYTGEGRFIPAVFRGGNGLWAIRSVTRFYFGSSSDIPVPADYNGDGTCDGAVYRSSSGMWAVRGITRRYFGSPADIPQPVKIGGSSSDRLMVFRSYSGLWAVEGLTRFYFGDGKVFPITSLQHWVVPELPVSGIEVMPYHLDEAHLDKLAESGARVGRVNHLSWAEVEPVNTSVNKFQWQEYDRILGEYAERGISPIVIISSIPTWAGETRTGPFNDTARADFAEFVGALVNRYHRPPYNIKFWEIFNEPDGVVPFNGPGCASSWGYHGKEYALMLKEIYPAVKAADPTSRVVMGGLAYDAFLDEEKGAVFKEFLAAGKDGVFNRDFIDDVLANGGGKYFDVMNFHYYYFARDRWGNITGKAEEMRRILESYGLSKPLICTEVGIWGYKDPYYLSLQARYLPMVYARGYSVDLGTVIWYPLATPQGWAFEGGLLREEDFSAKPAYVSYQTKIAELSGYKYSGVVQTGIENLEGYEFVSRRTGKSKSIIWAEEDTTGILSIPFENIRIVGIDGISGTIYDGGQGDLDKSANGKIQIEITSSPVYIESGN